MLDAGVAKEVARDVSPLATYSSAYVTCNPRSMMHFLSLRTKRPEAAFMSYPQWEINWVADQMEEIFKELWPMTHKAFHQNGRVALATYSSAYVTCNPRSMMHFLSLRTKRPEAAFMSYPQWEINWVADQMEEIFKELWPMTHKAFHQNGRVAP